MSLTTRQQKMLEFIRRYLNENQFPPTIREIGKAVGIPSTSVVNYNLNSLESKGFIERDRNVSRGLRLVDAEEKVAIGQNIVQIPLLGYIAAGEPSPIPESSADFRLLGDETIDLAKDMVGNLQDVYALKVRGDSMIDALINDGDVVIMKHQRTAENGDLVAAWLKDEHETTLKQFYHEGNKVRLQPANPFMQAMYFAAENVEVRGKVMMVIRQLD